MGMLWKLHSHILKVSQVVMLITIIILTNVDGANKLSTCLHTILSLQLLFHFPILSIIINNKNIWLGLTILVLKTQQFKVTSMFLLQYPTTFFTLNSIFQTSIILSVETKMENMKNMWFETQYNFKLLTISIIISSNYINFFVCKKTISHYYSPFKTTSQIISLQK